VNLIPTHWPAAESDVDVNVIGDEDVPDADSEPLTIKVRRLEFPCTVTPGSIVNVTPELTVTLPVITYGLFAAVHVVFTEIVPDTFVAAAVGGCASAKRATRDAIARTCGASDHQALIDRSVSRGV
jgi:hypothetical protein